MNNTLIKCENLTIGYNNIIVNNINFSLNRGDFIIITGNNGSGKTTFIKTLLKIIKPISGNIIYNCNHIGYMPQIISSLANFPISTLEVVLTGFNTLNINQKQKTKALNLLTKFNLDKYYNTSFNKLSGGQKQKVLLARAMCSDSDVLILDEPINNLDKETTQELLQLIDELHHENITIVMVTHSILGSLKYNYHIHFEDGTYSLIERE